jgi:hypothetical protein
VAQGLRRQGRGIEEEAEAGKGQVMSATILAVQDGLARHIPAHMHGGVMRYLERGVRPGDFLFAMLQGRLDDAYARADPTNQQHWTGWETFLSECLPAQCHGSISAVNDWMEHDGLAGLPDVSA